jgi:uncharacterized protein involved in outer membrane biogenesis
VYFNPVRRWRSAIACGLQETFMNNVLLFFGGLLVIVLSALFAVPNLVDWNSYRGVFEEEASKVLGREVRVGGSVNLKLLPAPYVRFEKVRIANARGQTGEPFVRADSFTMWLSGPALLRGVLEASEIELDKPVLTLAIDKSGGGNWSNIRLRSADLPFAPRNVTLRSVKLIDGAVSVYNAASERVVQMQDVSGELSADSLTGPFRFKGSVSWSGVAHDLAFATEAPSSDGSFGLKISARSDGSPNVYLVDGRVSDLDNKPAFEGAWTGTLTMPVDDAAASKAKGEAPLLNLKADVKADALGAKFEDITLSLDSAAEPQMITGSAVAAWTTPPRLDLKLESKWLDIDRLAGAGQGSASFSKLKQLTLGLMQSVAGDGMASAQINLQQVKVGGETAGGLSIDADRAGTITHIKKFNVSLPGGSRLNLTGDLKKNAEGQNRFSGNVFIGGTSLARLKGWAGKSGMPIDITSDGPFSLTGKIDIDQTRLAIADASGTISGRALAGDLTISQSGRKRTDLTLQAADLDTREIFPKTASALKTEFRKVLGLAVSDSGQAGAAELPGDMHLRVIAGRLTDGENVYHDVDVTFETEGKNINLPAAKLTTANGLVLSFEGRVKRRDSGPFGTLAYDAVAPTPEAMHELVSKAGLASLFGEAQFKGLQTGKLAGLIELGRRAPSATDVTFDGVVNNSHFGGSAEFDGGLGAWRSRPSHVRMSLKAPSMPKLLAILAQDHGDSGVGSDAPAEASLISVGTFSSGAKTRMEVAGSGLNIAFDGSVVWPENSPLVLNGSAVVNAGEAADALSVAGLSLPPGATDTAMHGTLDIGRDKGAWTIATRDLSLGTSTVSAYLQVGTGTDGRRHIEGKVGADRVSVAPLLSILTDKPPMPPGAGEGSDADSPAVEEAHSIWPSGVFKFSALDGVDADLRLSFASLDLTGNLATRDGEMQLALTPGKIAISDLSADAAGGQLTGALSLEKVRSGVALATDLKLDGAKLTSLSPTAKGSATFELKGGATAQSPAGLIAVMSGTGHVTLKDANLHGPSVATIADIADAVLLGKLQNDASAISTALLMSLTTSEVPLGSREVDIKLADGLVKFDPLTLEAPDGKLEATAAVDLTSLNASAACQVSARVRPLPPPSVALPGWKPTPPKAPLPPAVVLYDGPLDNLPVIKSSVDVSDLQRELSVRQVERNVDQLELSRRIDEERARIDKARRKALDAAAKKQTEKLPPVIPESAGTTNGQTSGANLGASAPQPAAEPNAQAAPNPPIVVPQADEQDDANAADAAHAGNGFQKITVEPIPAPGPVLDNSNQSTEPPVNSDAGLQAQAKDPDTVRPVKATRQRAPPRRRRTSTDEVLRSLGNIP